MKITRGKLKQIIAEELKSISEEAAPIDYKSYDELTDDQRKRVDQSVNTEIRALDMEGIEASDRAIARWRETYTKHVQDDDASTAASAASADRQRAQAQQRQDQEAQWMKILKDKYIDVPTIGKGEHAEYAGKQLPGGQLAIRMDHEVAQELEAAGTPVPEEFIKQVRQKLVPQDLTTHKGPEPGSAEWFRTRKGSGPSHKYDDSHLANPGVVGTAHMGYGESIDRSALKKIVQEELAKVLQGK